MRTTAKLWMGIGLLALLSPLGLILPERFKAGNAWGEWGADTLKELTGYVPQGLEKLSGLWNSPMPAYAFKGWENKGLSYLSMATIVSAVLGIAITALAVMLIGRLLSKKEE